MVVRLRRKTKLGMTLVEMLAAMAVTLILILALAQVFSIIGDNVADGRAIVEMSSAIRDTANRLHEDLDAITVPARPWPEPGSGLGYLECLEGNGYDLVPNSSNSLLTESIVGDIDDVLAFTVRTTGQPFVGRFKGTSVRSNVAEIIWWLELHDTNNNNGWDWNPTLGDKETFNLHRRVLLLRPDLNKHPGPDGEWGTADPGDDGTPDADKIGKFGQPGSDDLVALYIPAGSLARFLNVNDLSVHKDPVTGLYVANSLADLTRRQTRVGHGGSFPSPLRAALMPKRNTIHRGEDVILSNVIGFDIKVFDPEAPIMPDPTTGESVVPGDLGYNPSGTPQSYGAFVDLGFSRYRPGVKSIFSGRPHVKSKLTQYVYDTWSLDYEFDGINQDGGALDQGTNGLDDDGINGVDDLNERETSPPYPSPLRGIQIVIRTLDPDSRQVRQITVTSDFTPE